MHLSEIWHSKKNDCRLSRTQVTKLIPPTGSNNLSSVEYKAKKYGESSYYIVLEDLTAGEYGIVIGDPNHENTKNAMKVTTFTVE